MNLDLGTAGGLANALAKTGTWAELSRRPGVPASTLRSRGARLGVHVPADLDGHSATAECVAAFATTIAHAIVATVVELEKGLPIEDAWQVHERRLQRDVVAVTQRLLEELSPARRGDRQK